MVLWITGLAVCAAGCHMNKNISTPGRVLSADESLVRKVILSQQAWNFVEMRVTGKTDMDGDRFSFMGTIRMQRNKQLFISVRSAIGIEAARIYATPDSLWIMSKMMGIKERWDWKQVRLKTGYPIDFQSLQGILTHALFTSAGDSQQVLIEQLGSSRKNNEFHLVTNEKTQEDKPEMKYLPDFRINTSDYSVESANIRDINGQWIIDVLYEYHKDGMIRKIGVKGLDTDSQVSLDMTVVKKEYSDNLDINFSKF
jgi:hypothetical protein